ncbi:alpha/beta hydrolase [Nocardia arthritidis]|uniref:Esterase family protein n=1 Tax=Nocardia arthritidis TaxID=228602 RepID=A0A6G9YBW2_9NOCA|nr:alpha/beta hydrolase family protein [Nocardia arthritidis]QIS10546.1 esterase family protein [Nocardia arthritidis]
MGVEIVLRKVMTAGAALIPLISGIGAATADTTPAAAVVRIDQLGPTRSKMLIDSPAMQRVVEVHVLHPDNDEPRPAYYLLDGVDSEPPETNWTQHTDIVRFFADKQVNVVLPVGGEGSYYTDWERPDPHLGGQLRWETFLTDELPPLIDKVFDGNGRNAIGGLSMGAASAAILATRHPDLYRGLATFSGCIDTLEPNAKLAIRESISWVGGNPDNMWGPDNDPAWQAHDPLANAEALRGKTIYVSVGNGASGPETWSDPQMPAAVTFGALLEYAARLCTEEFQRRLGLLGVPATFVYREVGTHSWPYWQIDLHESWPAIAAALAE